MNKKAKPERGEPEVTVTVEEAEAQARVLVQEALDAAGVERFEPPAIAPTDSPTD